MKPLQSIWAIAIGSIGVGMLFYAFNTPGNQAVLAFVGGFIWASGVFLFVLSLGSAK